MITITIENAISQVVGLTRDVEKRIKDELRYLNQNVSYSCHQLMRQIESLRDSRFNAADLEIQKLERQLHFHQKKMYTYLYKDKQFPTGLIPKVVKLLQNLKLDYQIVDRRIKPKTSVKYVLKESLPPLRYYQRTAARMIKEKGRGVVVAPTGTGKTLTLARMIWELDTTTLVVTPSKAITDNTIETLTKYFGKGRIQKLNTKTSKLKDINVVNIQALVKLKPELFKDINAVFIDEFHHSAASTFQEANIRHFKNCYYRVGLTATNFRNDGSDLALEAVLSEVVYEYSIEQALKDGFLVQPKFQVMDMDAKAEDTYQKEYKESLVNNVARNRLVSILAEKHSNDSVLILVQQIEHGELLKPLIKNAEFISGQESDSDRQHLMEDFKKGKLKCLIGTSVLGEGVDLPIANVLILAGGGKARSAVIQNVGRVLRPFEGKTEALVYDFTDSGSNFLERHSELRSEVYDQYLLF